MFGFFLGKHVSLSRLNYSWPTYEGHPAMMEGVAARLLCWQRGLTGWNEARPHVYSHTGESQERGRAGPQARAGSTSQCGGLLASEASWTINRDKLNRGGCASSSAQCADPLRSENGRRSMRSQGQSWGMLLCIRGPVESSIA